MWVPYTKQAQTVMIVEAIGLKIGLYNGGNVFDSRSIFSPTIYILPISYKETGIKT